MARARRKSRGLYINKAKEFLNYLNYLSNNKPLFPWMIVLILVGWVVERWVLCFTNFLPLAIAFWATYQYGNHQAQIQVQVLERRWRQIMLLVSPVTPLEHCEWLNKLLCEVWINFINPKLSFTFSSMVEKRLKHRKPPFIEKIELQEFSLGSCPPSLGLHGTRWSMFGDQRIMQMGFDWDTTDMSILLAAKLAKPLMGTAKICINSIHIKGELVLRPILDGKGVLYSFLSSPEVRINVAFGSGGSQSLPATELPCVSSWLVKLLNDTLEKTMVEPRRDCLSLPPVDLRKEAAGGILYVKVISASKVSSANMKAGPSRRQQNSNFEGYYNVEKDLCTFVEVELEQLSRKTDVRSGSSPKWDSTFNMVLHDATGILRFHLYASFPGSVKYNHLTSCEIKMQHVADDSVMYWALGYDNGVVAEHAAFCGKEIEMVVPFEEVDSGELTVRLILKEWHFSDCSRSLSSFHPGSTRSLSGSSSGLTSNTRRKISVTVVEAKGLVGSDPYVKLQYGKAFHRTRTMKDNKNPVWNKQFEFEELECGECLNVKCYNEDIFGNQQLGGARVSLEGLVEGSVRDVWIPLEKVDSGELRLRLDVSWRD
ncbi:uncharacterized protein LOC124909744 [Impatiens glandulifera]|uniref:uncharacterized protein LOC124909744 n=1 Tax=Impatiens glandulifera TaxID=253017 RepID=UPI001FB16885|nr:uncharacterized protein LOC124909744 [Impatiens glandulifera]